MHHGGEPEQAKGLDVLWLCTVACTYVHGVACTVDVEKGKMSTWLYNG